MAGQRYTLVTVVFEKEYDFLALQARSLRLYCPADLVADIVIVENSAKTMSGRARRRILAEYGDLARLVRFVPIGGLGIDPAAARGWITQQVAKLRVATIVATDRYVSLDAKNHLVYPLQRTFLEAPGDRGRLRRLDYTGNPLRRYFDRVMAFWGLDADAYRSAFTQSSTPYMLYTAVVRRMLVEIESRDSRSLTELFVECHLTEFLLYAAYVAKFEGGIDRFYETHERFSPVVWTEKASLEGCREMIGWTDPLLAPFFAVHRHSAVELDAPSRALVAGFWRERGLFASESEGLRLIARFRRRERLRRLRALPRRAAGKAKRAVLRFVTARPRI